MIRMATQPKQKEPSATRETRMARTVQPENRGFTITITSLPGLPPSCNATLPGGKRTRRHRTSTLNWPIRGKGGQDSEVAAHETDVAGPKDRNKNFHQPHRHGACISLTFFACCQSEESRKIICLAALLPNSPSLTRTHYIRDTPVGC